MKIRGSVNLNTEFSQNAYLQEYYWSIQPVDLYFRFPTEIYYFNCLPFSQCLSPLSLHLMYDVTHYTIHPPQPTKISYSCFFSKVLFSKKTFISCLISFDLPWLCISMCSRKQLKVVNLVEKCFTLCVSMEMLQLFQE